MGRRWVRELGKPSPAPVLADREQPVRITVSSGKSHRAGRVADGVVVPLEGLGQHNPARWEGPLPRRALADEGTGR